MRIVLAFLMLMPTIGIAQYDRLFSMSLGMVSLSLTENPSTLESTDGSVASADADAPESSAVSSMAMKIDYDYLTYRRFSLFATGIVPMMSSDGSAVWIASTGINFYFSGNSSVLRFYERGTNLKISPTYRFYLGCGGGVGYVIYNTISQRKTDVAFEIEAHGGALYSFKSRWGLKGEIGMGKWTGVLSNSMAMKIFLGAIYSI